jgi:hypothetical protein
LGVFVKNPGEVRDFILQLRTLHPENIRIKDVKLFYEELLPNFLPEGVFLGGYVFLCIKNILPSPVTAWFIAKVFNQTS